MMNTTRTTRRLQFMLASSAVVLLVCILVVIGRDPAPRVEAGMVASDDSFTLMTAPARTGGGTEKTDLLYVIDNFNGILLTYRFTTTGATTKINLVDRGFIEHLFDSMRPQNPGRPGSPPQGIPGARVHWVDASRPEPPCRFRDGAATSRLVHQAVHQGRCEDRRAAPGHLHA